MMSERTNYPNASTGTVIIIDLESTCLRSAFVLYASNIQLLPYCKITLKKTKQRTDQIVCPLFGHDLVLIRQQHRLTRLNTNNFF